MSTWARWSSLISSAFGSDICFYLQRAVCFNNKQRKKIKCKIAICKSHYFLKNSQNCAFTLVKIWPFHFRDFINIILALLFLDRYALCIALEILDRFFGLKNWQFFVFQMLLFSLFWTIFFSNLRFRACRSNLFCFQGQQLKQWATLGDKRFALFQFNHAIKNLRLENLYNENLRRRLWR